MEVPASSPMHPVAPPTKKQRSSNVAPLRGIRENDSFSTATGDAIARRRAELRRLQQRRGLGSNRPSAAESLIAQAKSQLNNPLSNGGPPPGPPPTNGSRAVRHRTSDIFPTVPKALSSAKSKQPPPTATMNGSHSVTSPPTGAQVARKLDPAFAAKNTTGSSEGASRPKSAPPARPPPPPVAPSLVAEAPPSIDRRSSPVNRDHSQRPSPITPTLGAGVTPAASARRNLLNNLRAMADSPAQSNGGSDLKLIKELKKAKKEKEDAFRKIARLQEQMQQLQRQERKSQDIATLVQLANKDGDRAAVQWARQQVSGSQTPRGKVGFMSPVNRAVSPSRRALTPSMAVPVRKRVATPHPKRVAANENEEFKFLQEATKSTPDEYFSTHATYVVRHPYQSGDENEFWTQNGGLSAAEYSKSADVGRPASVEVAAKITADGSVLTLHGISYVRHKKASSNKWREFPDVDGMDKPLGCVMYTDSDANDQEYWLDEIYEEAMSTRETYCSSLISTATALQSNKLLPRDSPEKPQEIVKIKPVEVIKEVIKEVERSRPPTADACVGTDPMVAPSPTPKAKRPPEESKEASQRVPPPPEDEGTSDVLSVMLGMLFSGIFGLVWLLLVRIPFRIFSFTMLLVTGGAILSVVWLYLADDHGAQSMGAGLGYGFNRPGIV